MSSSPVVISEEDEIRLSLAASKLALAMETSRRISQNQRDEVEAEYREIVKGIDEEEEGGEDGQEGVEEREQIEYKEYNGADQNEDNSLNSCIRNRKDLQEREQEFLEYKARVEKLNLEYVSHIDSDTVLRELVARKVEMQNTALDFDTKEKCQAIEGEVKRLSAQFEIPTSSSSRRMQMRELRKKQVMA